MPCCKCPSPHQREAVRLQTARLSPLSVNGAAVSGGGQRRPVCARNPLSTRPDSTRGSKSRFRRISLFNLKKERRKKEKKIGLGGGVGESSFVTEVKFELEGGGKLGWGGGGGRALFVSRFVARYKAGRVG